MTMTAARALERARALREHGAGAATGRTAGRRRRSVAIGDPQASAERFFEVLAHHRLLDDSGWLRDDVHAISIGDHFDIDVTERAAARIDGVLILGWLAAHPRDQVAIIFGNHDAARVMELALTTDERFQAAAELGRAILDLPPQDRAELTAQFRARFPELSTPGYAARDYNSFTVEQRALVQALLLARRFDLATTARLQSGAVALVTHAGVTLDELADLPGIESCDPVAIAAALDAWLDTACTAVADSWRRGDAAALSLEPLHVAGSDGEEGGGLLYHRPADLDRQAANQAWESAPKGPRRFDPRRLPRGLVQVFGHTGHTKAFRDLARWREAGMDDAPGGLRTLRVTGEDQVTYRRGVHAGAANDAVAVMIDPEMRRVSRAADVDILELTPASNASANLRRANGLEPQDRE